MGGRRLDLFGFGQGQVLAHVVTVMQYWVPKNAGKCLTD